MICFIENRNACTTIPFKPISFPCSALRVDWNLTNCLIKSTWYSIFLKFRLEGNPIKKEKNLLIVVAEKLISAYDLEIFFKSTSYEFASFINEKHFITPKIYSAKKVNELLKTFFLFTAKNYTHTDLFHPFMLDLEYYI